MIAIIDYDLGNVGSIKNILKKINNEDVIITRDCQSIEQASKLILPGVGSFDAGMENLEKFQLIDVLNKRVLEDKVPLLGICLGMQLLGESSEEGKKSGLGYIPFRSVRFNDEIDYKIPHMGWDYVTLSQPNNDILKGLCNERQRYYFVHSYHALCERRDNILMECEYGYNFAAAVTQENIYGVQFHPEKSHRFGMQLLKNFVRL